MGETERQVRYGIDRGRIPAVKEGGLWCPGPHFGAILFAQQLTEQMTRPQ